MAKYRVTTDQGTYEVTTEDSQPQQKQNFLRKGWDALAKPEQLSRQGLQQISNMIPEGKITGNLPADIARGTPRILANTMAQAAPGFVSRGALVTAGAAPVLGALGKAAAPLGKSIASGLEDWAGIKPTGTLAEAAKDPTLLFAKGKDAAGKFYEAGKSELPKGASVFQGMYKPEQIVDKAREILDKGGKLEPSEGLVYRKAIDSLMKSGRYVKDELMSMRDEADAIAKSSENIATGDVTALRGMRANAMRSLFPKNVGGRASPFKVGEAMALSHFGPAGKAASVLFSPLALGSGVTAGGVAGRLASNPRSAVAIQQLLRQMRKKNEDDQ